MSFYDMVYLKMPAKRLGVCRHAAFITLNISGYKILNFWQLTITPCLTAACGIHRVSASIFLFFNIQSNCPNY
jgi:hypothetical protein